MSHTEVSRATLYTGGIQSCPADGRKCAVVEIVDHYSSQQVLGKYLAAPLGIDHSHSDNSNNNNKKNSKDL